MSSKHQITMRMAPIYRRARKKEKPRIRNEYMAITGLTNRKYAETKLNRYAIDPPPDPSIRKKRNKGHGGRKRIYGPKETAVLITCWAASFFSCSDNLKALLPSYIQSLKASGKLIVEPDVEARVLKVSRAQIDRILKPYRCMLRIKKTHRRITKPGSIQSRIPIRTGPWGTPELGYTEIDLVHHGGPSSEGEFAHTLNMTDIATGWTEFMAIFGRAQERTFVALRALQNDLPFPLRGIDSDNDKPFINDQLERYTREQGIEFTRCRPYHKNDQAHIEQKNWACIRRFLGYIRIDTQKGVDLMNYIYRKPLRLYINLFQASKRCVDKVREGSKVRKIYEAPKTPYERLMERDDVPQETKETLRKIYLSLNPIDLLKEIHEALEILGIHGGWEEPERLVEYLMNEKDR